MPFSSLSTLVPALVPSALLVAAVYAVKPEFLAYAIAVASVITGFAFFSNSSMSSFTCTPDRMIRLTPIFRAAQGPEPYRFPGLYPQGEERDFSQCLHLPFCAAPPTDILGLPIGQHISLAATIAGQPKEVVRSYTPISSDNEAGYFDLLIKAYPQGNISKYLTELKVGQTMKVRGPKGAMVYTPNMCRHIGMIAGGTGITPMLQVIEAIIRNRPRNGGNDTTKVDLIFANVNPEDILLQEKLEKLAKEDSDFRVYYVLNNPPAGWIGGVGFVTPDMIKERLPAPASDVKVLLCGPPPMVSAMKKATESLGYTKARPVSKLEDQVFCF
ncbi:hypothetical protein N7526_003342 [Penicillium atrosanguineum]|nr:hypothetical protein N7526_003342 [Penicillium atrosanguineum]